jgi:serine/threonine-protein kinase
MSEKARARFAREARAGFKITSEHVARVFDLGTLDDGMQYMAMEYLEGQDFAQLLALHGRLPWDIAVGFILQVCEAVAEAHAIGIVHRDLKPENLFLCRRADGTPCVKVLDFGLAKLAHRSQSLTRVNRGMGTPRYMAPEQWVSARDVGPAADIWALGVIVYELVSGKSPYDDQDIKKLSQAVLFAAPPGMASHGAEVPPGLESVVDRCLQKKPEHRYTNVAALASALLPFAPHVARGRLDDMVRSLSGSSWALSLTASSASQSTAWLDATLLSDEEQSEQPPDEPTTVDEPHVDWDEDSAPTDVLIEPATVQDDATRTELMPRSRLVGRRFVGLRFAMLAPRRRRLLLLAVLAVVVGALLAVITVHEPPRNASPTPRSSP